MSSTLIIAPCSELVFKVPNLGTIQLTIRQPSSGCLTFAVQTVPQYHSQSLALIERAGELLESLPPKGTLADAIAAAKRVTL